jgi:hypothetical protein
MKTIDKLRLFIVFAATSACVVAGAWAAEPLSSKKGHELLVLRNGQILEGRVSKLKGQYLVDLPDGEIRVRDSEADFVCGSLDDAYQRKRAVIQVDGWQDHLDLARWCQRHNLIEQAKAELAIAEQASPNNPMLAALRRQMDPIADTPPTPMKPPSEDDVSKDELDRIVRNLPTGTMETFTQTVQPTLINNCTATGCHGPQSTTNLRLFRVSSGEAANWRVSQRNLLTVLRYVNRENPAESPLLTVPSSPHGTAKAAIFNERRASQFQRLSAWAAALDAGEGPSRFGDANGIAQVRAGELSREPAPSAPGLLSPDAQKAKPLAARKKSETPRTSESDSAGEEVLPASYQEPPAEFLQSSRARNAGAVSSRKTVPPLESSMPAPPIQKVQRGAPLLPSARSDPFDPEVFNRRYHPAAGTPEGEKPPTAAAPTKNPPTKG